MFKQLCLTVSILLSCISPSIAGEVRDFFPKQNLPQFLAEHFDLSTIRSSFGPKRERGKSAFLTHFYSSPNVDADSITVDTDGWLYQLKVLGVKDENGDGVQDVIVCFKDKANNGGTYNINRPYLITRYSNDMPAIALAFSPYNENCIDTSEENHNH